MELRRDLEEALAGQITGQPSPLPHSSTIDSSSSSETTSPDPFISHSVQSRSLEYAYQLFQFPVQPILKRYFFCRQFLKTPIRKTPMPDIPGAYLTPESLPRQLGADSYAQNISPPGTPTYSYHTDGQESQDMDAGIAISSSIATDTTSLQHLLPISEIFGPNWTSVSSFRRWT